MKKDDLHFLQHYTEIAPKKQKRESALEALEKKKAELRAQINKVEQAIYKVKKDLEVLNYQVGLLQLYTGEKVEIIQIRSGEPAPAETPITVRQQVLCMDEEIALHDWINHPERIGKFDYQNLEDFDRWIAKHPEIAVPEQKGVVCFRVRRYDKKYYREDDFLSAMLNAETNVPNKYTYFFIRNGENLYRIWAPISVWPYLFPKADAKRDYDDDTEKKQSLRAASLIQGLLDRTNIFHPLPEAKLSLMQNSKYIRFLRDAEMALSSGQLTWYEYKKWLQEQVNIGTRVLLDPKISDTKVCDRTYIKSIFDRPDTSKLYVIDKKETGGYWGFDWSFLYMPDDDVYDYAEWTYKKREKRVRYRVYANEVIPYDLLDWRKIDEILHNREDRHNYASSFETFFHWRELKREEEEIERPFMDLVLKECDLEQTDENYALVAEKIRWWKFKTKFHRSISEDDKKAFRMIVKAIRGETENEV